MRYQDDDNSVNAFYIGESVGTRLADSLAPDDDGLDHLRGVERSGTILGDAADTDFPQPLIESEEEDDD